MDPNTDDLILLEAVKRAEERERIADEKARVADEKAKQADIIFQNSMKK